MTKIVQHVKQFLNDEEGVTAIEYGMIGAVVAIGILAALQALGGGLNAVFNRIDQVLRAAV